MTATRHIGWLTAALIVLALHLWAPWPSDWLETGLLLAIVALVALVDALTP